MNEKKANRVRRASERLQRQSDSLVRSAERLENEANTLEMLQWKRENSRAYAQELRQDSVRMSWEANRILVNIYRKG